MIYDAAVLIETLWNVKVYQSTAEFGNLVRINRNIVECKVASGYTKLESDSVLIETLWNVKNLRAPRKLTEEQSINRNIVECKAAKKRRRKNPEDCINRNIMECQRLRTIFYIGIPPPPLMLTPR